MRHAERRELRADFFGEHGRALRAKFREVFCLRSELSFRFGDIFPKLRDVFVVVLDVGEFLLHLLLVFEDVFDGRAVFLAELVDDIHAALELVELLRAEIHVFAIVANLGSSFLQRDGRIFDDSLRIGERRVITADVFEVLLDGRERRKDAKAIARITIHEAIGFADAVRNLFGMGELSDLFLETVVLSDFEPGVLDFLILPSQHVETLGILARIHLPLLERLLAIVPERILCAVVGERLRDGGILAVEQVILACFLEQGEVLVLPVDVDEVCADLLEHGERHMAAIDEDVVAAGARYLPCHD